MQLTLQEISILRQFLGRSTLTGNEVGAMIQVANKLTEIEQFLNTPKAKRGNKELPTASK